jgi:hypothetical protein
MTAKRQKTILNFNRMLLKQLKEERKSLTRNIKMFKLMKLFSSKGAKRNFEEKIKSLQEIRQNIVLLIQMIEKPNSN